MRRAAAIAGVGALAFSVLFFTAWMLVNSPGGGYTESTVTQYLAADHLPVVLVALCLAQVGVVGLLCRLSYLRELMGKDAEIACESIWHGQTGPQSRFLSSAMCRMTP